ncbi:hypothetical protein ACPCXF_20920 [Lysinibacillus agricola]
MGISDRGTKAKSITSCDNASVTNIGAVAASLHYAFAQKTIVVPNPLGKRPVGTEINPTLW